MVMDDVQKMFRTIVNGQSALKSELLSKFDKLEEKFEFEINKLRKGMTGGFVKVNKRLDLQGKQLAFLEDLPAMLFA